MRNIFVYLSITIILTSFSSCTTQDLTEQLVVPPEETPAELVQETAVSPEVIEAESSDTLNEIEIKEAETNISELIQTLNDIIASKDFQNWKKHLSDDYINYYSNPDVLKEKSQSPLLTKNKIVLRSLEDYFNYVVVGSRQNVKLDEIKALDRDRIKAYMFINNKAVIIYELVRIDDNWKIGKFLE